MTDDDPVPLKAGGEASPELVRALKALGKGTPDAARLARVAEKLGAAIGDLPPGGSSGFGKLIGTKTLITAIVIGVAALSYLGYHLAGRQPSAPSESTQPPPPPAATESSRIESPTDAAPLASSQSNLDAASPFANQPTHTLTPAAGSPRRWHRAVPASAPASAHVAIAARAAQATEGSASTQHAATKETSDPAVAPPAAKASHAVKPEPAEETSSVPQRSEVELLFDARKAMSSQPAAALRALDEHAARFPGGMLAPEREVLRIEALRKLGRTAEATKRLQQFQSRYPDSIHLRRLEGDAGRSQ